MSQVVREIRVGAEPLESWAGELLASLGAPASTARVVSSSLVASDVRGHDSHGVRRLRPYADLIAQGRLDVTAVPGVVADTPPAVARIDGSHAFGQLTARRGAHEAADRAAKMGIGLAVLGRCEHVGRLGEYVELIAERGYVGYAFANADPTVAAWGGRSRLLGTNPLAWAVPTPVGAAPVVVDFATSATAEGKLAVAVARGESVSEGLVVDAEGDATTDPRDFYDGGALLPFGGHKGYGLGLVADLVAGLFSGTGSASSPDYDGTFGTVLIAIDVEPFLPREEFVSQVELLRDRVHSSAPVTGFRGVVLPGEPEWGVREERLASGIILAPGTVAALDDLAAQQGVRALSDLDEEKRS